MNWTGGNGRTGFGRGTTSTFQHAKATLKETKKSLVQRPSHRSEVPPLRAKSLFSRLLNPTKTNSNIQSPRKSRDISQLVISPKIVKRPKGRAKTNLKPKSLRELWIQNGKNSAAEKERQKKVLVEKETTGKSKECSKSPPLSTPMSLNTHPNYSNVRNQSESESELDSPVLSSRQSLQRNLLSLPHPSPLLKSRRENRVPVAPTIKSETDWMAMLWPQEIQSVVIRGSQMTVDDDSSRSNSGSENNSDSKQEGPSNRKEKETQIIKKSGNRVSLRRENRLRTSTQYHSLADLESRINKMEARVMKLERKK
ncbi:hypothetical protein BDR26DRAFT_865689, partial [Obelidium mucronatum]